MKMLIILCLLLGKSRANEVELEGTCGARLRPHCPALNKFVVGGTPSCAELAPWNVILEPKPGRRKRQSSILNLLCGGTLVTSSHILTAAHCVWANRGGGKKCREPYLSMTPEECKRAGCPRSCRRTVGSDLNVYLGITDRTTEPKPRPVSVKAIHIHPGWNRKMEENNITAGHDLAVLELAEPVSLSEVVWPICLPSPADLFLAKEGKNVEINGFGLNDFDILDYPEILQNAHLSIFSQSHCRELWRLQGDQLCAAGTDNGGNSVSDSCNGDSGGGLVAKRHDQSFVLLGIVSFGESLCGQGRGRPGVYTNILSHTSWIRGVISGNQGKEAPCTTQDGGECVFPFRFSGNTYHSCTIDTDPDNRHWCSTMVDSAGNHMQGIGEWGYCTDACSGTAASDTEIAPPGYWTNWSSWTPCTRSCGGGQKVRTRVCIGVGCEGRDITLKPCATDSCKPEKPVSEWSSWGGWSSCSRSCGGGVRDRKRLCLDTSQSARLSARIGIVEAAPSLTEGDCEGSGTQQESCSTTPCVRKQPEQNSGKRRVWASWSAFSTCSTTCSGGVKRRTRTCIGDRGDCYGSPSDFVQCGSAKCEKSSVTARGATVVLIGGWQGDFINTVTILDGNGKSCEGPRLPIWLADHFSVLVGNRILTCGGRDGEDRTLCWTWNVEAKETGKWERYPTMLTGRSYSEAVVTQNSVWVSGGWDGKARHNTTEISVLGSSGWVPGPDISGNRYQHCGVVLQDGSVVLTGGQEGREKFGQALNTVEKYSIRTGLIETLPSLNQARWTHACAVIAYGGGEVVLVAGGRVTSGRGDELDTVEWLRLGSRQWENRAPLPQPRIAPSIAVINGAILLSGGSYEAGIGEEIFPEYILEYHPSMDSWSPVQTIKGRSHHTSVSLRNNIISCN